MGTSAIIRDQMGRAQPTMPGNAVPPPSPFLGVLPPWMWDAPKKLWQANFTPQGTAVAAAAQLSMSYTVDDNFYFVGYYGSLIVRADAAGKAIQADYPLTVFLSTQNNDVYQPAGTTNDVNNVFGTAKQPSVWALPMILPPRTTLTALFTNTGATTVNIWPMLQGFLVASKYKNGGQ
jgi:hypothetical protein